MSEDRLIGTVLGSYSIESRVGRGGMGVVYRAEHVHLGRPVALKVLAERFSSDQDFRRRFIRESQLAARLEHPNVIPVYDAGESTGLLYIAMRFVEGTDLRRLIEGEGRLEPGRALSLLGGVAGALDEAHRGGLIHRDVKPGNILIERGGMGGPERVFLTDFGLVKRMNADTRITRSGSFLGTLEYVAPEVLQGQPLDGRADLYSLACVLYECLAGTVPFVRETDVALMAAHLMAPPPSLKQVRPDLPEGLDGVIARGMAKSPDDRYRTSAEFIARARAALTETVLDQTTRTPAVVETTLTPTVADPTVAHAHPPVAPPLAPPPVADPTVAHPHPPVAAARRSTAPKAGPDRTVRLEPIVPRTEVITKVPGRPPGRRRRSASVGIAAAVLIVGAAAAGAIILRSGRPGSPGSPASPASASSSRTPPESPSPKPPAGTVLARIPFDATPFAVAAGPKTVWVTSYQTGLVTRIEAGKRQVSASVHVGSSPNAAAIGFGSVWVTDRVDRKLYRIDPAANSAAPGVPVGPMPYAVATGEGSVWVADHQDHSVWRIDPATGAVQDQIQVGGTPSGVAVGEGSVWVTDSAGGTVSRIDPAGGGVTPIPVGNGPSGVAVGYGSVWVVNHDDATVSRIDVATESISATIPVGSKPLRVAVGGRAVWVTDSGAGTVSRIDPASDTVQAIEVGRFPVGIAAGGGAVWVANATTRSVWALQL